MKFLKPLFLVCQIFVIIIFSSCDKEERERLQRVNDSLRTQLMEDNEAVLAMKEVSVLIDSADAARNVLRIDMIEGIPLESYKEKMERVLEYVKKSESKIAEMQSRFKKFRDSTSGYVMMIEALTGELEIAREQIQDLQVQYDEAAKKNTELVKLVAVQKNQLSKNDVKIEESKKEITKYEKRIADLMNESRSYQGELYFTKAELAYEEARKTKLAPRKKKDLLKESLELYQKAAEMGNKQASAKISEVKKKI